VFVCLFHLRFPGVRDSWTSRSWRTSAVHSLVINTDNESMHVTPADLLNHQLNWNSSTNTCSIVCILGRYVLFREKELKLWMPLSIHVEVFISSLIRDKFFLVGMKQGSFLPLIEVNIVNIQIYTIRPTHLRWGNVIARVLL